METNDNKNTTIQNLWDTTKAVLRGKYIAVQAFLKKQERSQVHSLTLHLKELEEEQQIRPKSSRRQEIIMIRAEINEIDIERTVEQINKTRSWFIERINKFDNPVAELTKRKGKGPKLIKS